MELAKIAMGSSGYSQIHVYVVSATMAEIIPLLYIVLCQMVLTCLFMHCDGLVHNGPLAMVHYWLEYTSLCERSLILKWFSTTQASQLKIELGLCLHVHWLKISITIWQIHLIAHHSSLCLVHFVCSTDQHWCFSVSQQSVNAVRQCSVTLLAALTMYTQHRLNACAQ